MSTSNIELFPDLPESKSPKKAWLDRHQVCIMPIDPLDPDEPNPNLWACGFTRDFGDDANGLNMHAIVEGKTEAEAIVNFCERYNIKHWTLE